MSLPGVAEEIAYRYFNTKSPPICSFGPSFKVYNQEIRKQLYGLVTYILYVVDNKIISRGMTIVLHRFIDLGRPTSRYPIAAYYAENAEKFRRMVFYDFNSLYPWAFQQNLPTGPGLCFEKNGGAFKLRSMHQHGKNSSLAAVEWIEVCYKTW